MARNSGKQSARPPEHDDQEWLGVVAASHLLGVHRSTVNAAVNQQQLVPDMFTPGGHARFKRGTLEAFRERQSERATATETVTRLRALSDLARLAQGTGTPEEVAREALRIIQRVQPNVDLCCMVRHMPSEHNPWSVRLLAQEGFPEDVLEMYRRLAPNQESTTIAVLKSGKQEYCADTLGDNVRYGSVLFTRQLDIRSYLVLPLLGERSPFGVLVLLSRKTHAFAAGDMLFLATAANQLTSALISAQRLADVRKALRATHDMTVRAMLLPDGTPKEQARGTALAASVAIFQWASGADMVCTLGFEQNVTGDAPRLWELAARACERRSIEPSMWGSGEGLRTGVAMYVPLPGDRHAAVAAAWKGERATLELDYILLTALASACVHASLRRTPPSARSSRRK